MADGPHRGPRVVGVQRQHEHVGVAERRRGTGLRLPSHLDADQRLLRRLPPRRQPVRREHRLPRREDRAPHLALPGRPPRHLGLRLPGRAERHRPRGRRQGRAGQGTGRGEQAGVHLRLRSRHRRADLADRGAPGAARRRAGRVVRADPAVPDQAAAVRPAGDDGRRPDRLHAGNCGQPRWRSSTST